MLKDQLHTLNEPEGNPFIERLKDEEEDPSFVVLDEYDDISIEI